MAKKKYFKFGLLRTAENVITGLIKFIFSIIIIKKFGPSVQGQYSYINTIASYFTIFSISIIDQSSIVTIPKIKNQILKLSDYLGSAIVTTFLFITISMGIFAVLLNYNLIQKLPLPFYIIALYLTVFAFRHVLKTIILGTEKYIYYSTISIVFELIQLSALFIANSLFSYFLITSCIIVIAITLLLSSILKEINWKISCSFNDIKNIGFYGGKMFFYVLFQTILFRIDVFFIMYLYDAKSLSYYMICTVFAELIVLPFKSITAIVINKTISHESSFTLLNFRILNTLIICVGIAIIITGTFLIPFLYGKEYGEQINVFWIQSLGSILVAFIYIYNYYLLGKGFHKIIIFSYSVALIPALVLYYLLSKNFGIIGTSIASTTSYALIFSVLIFGMSKNLLQFKSYKFLLPTFETYHFLKKKLHF